MNLRSKRILLANSDLVDLHRPYQAMGRYVSAGNEQLCLWRLRHSITVPGCFFRTPIAEGHHRLCVSGTRIETLSAVDTYVVTHSDETSSFIMPCGSSGMAGSIRVAHDTKPTIRVYFGFHHDFSFFCLALRTARSLETI